MFWIERFIRYFGIRHPDTMCAPEVEAFLTHLAVDGHVASSTQNQPLAARLQRLDTHHGLGGMVESLSQGFNEVECELASGVGFSEALVTPQPRCDSKSVSTDPTAASIYTPQEKDEG